MRILVDANVLLRAVGSNLTDRELANGAVQRLLKRRDEPVVVPQVLYEWWVVATRPRAVNGLGLDAPSAFSVLKTLESYFTLIPDDGSIYNEWRRLVAVFGVSGKNAHDARLVAAMNVHEINHILTFNRQDFTRYSQLTILTPAAIQ